jgi:hypothetical protein
MTPRKTLTMKGTPRAAERFTPRIALPVTRTRMWRRFTFDMNN